MRPRTLLIIILVIVVVGILALVAITQLDIFNNDPNNNEPIQTGATLEGESGGEVSSPLATSTPTTLLVDVVVAKDDIALGTRITADMIRVAERPDNNIAILTQITFDDPELIIGQIAKTNISQGQEIIAPMLALNTTDLDAFGSDLALFVDQGKVAVAFPIDKYSGLAYTMRPGDFLDVLMSLPLIEIDPELRTSLPNQVQRIIPFLNEDGTTKWIFFPPLVQGRLELIEELNSIGAIMPQNGIIERNNREASVQQIPRRVTQLTLQQVEVVWVGTWVEQQTFIPEDEEVTVEGSGEESALGGLNVSAGLPSGGGDSALPAAAATIEPTKERPEDVPDVVILSMSAQDALILKWSLERGVDIHLALRAQGDTSVFSTVSVSLPQLIEQGGITIPELESAENFDLYLRADEIPAPVLPDENPNANVNDATE